MSECSLIYLPASYSDQVRANVVHSCYYLNRCFLHYLNVKLIEWAANATTAESAFVLYEQVRHKLKYDSLSRIPIFLTVDQPL